MSKPNFGKQIVGASIILNSEEAFALGVEYGDKETNPLVSNIQYHELNKNGHIILQIQHDSVDAFLITMTRSWNKAYKSEPISDEDMLTLFNSVFGNSDFYNEPKVLKSQP